MIFGNTTLVTAPASEPVTATEAKAHMRVDGSTEDTLIGNLIKAARVIVERKQNRQLITATWDAVFDRFPYDRVIRLPLPPLQSVTSIKYIDVDGVEQTFSSSKYTVVTNSVEGRIELNDGEAWPTTSNRIGAVTIRFVAGYGSNTTDVPETTRLAILQLVAHWFETREPVVIGQGVNKVPFSVEALIACETVAEMR